jgi:hypothetical protein
MKERYWVCGKCHRICKRRKSDETRCCCGQPMRAARKWPAADAAKRARAHRGDYALRMAARKRWSVVRGRDGNVIRISAQTKRAMRDLKSAKRRDSFERRAQAFVDSLGKDARACQHGVVWPDRCPECGTRFLSGCGWGGPTGFPQFVCTTLRSAYGEFHLDGGHYAIRLDWRGLRGNNEYVDTIVHECVHWLDRYWEGARDRQGIKGTHDCTFNARVADLSRRLGVK